MTSDEIAGDPRVLRLMRLLRPGPARLSPAAGGDSLLVSCGDRGTLAICRTALRAAASAGLLQVKGGGLVELTQHGHAVFGSARADALSAAPRQEVTTDIAGPNGHDRVRFNQAESPLTHIAARKDRNGRPFLSPHEIAAGERLRADYERASILPRLGINWEQPIAKGRAGAARPLGPELNDGVLAARRRVEEAFGAVGPELAGVLVDVCCFLKGLERVEAERGWPVRSAKIVLKTALSALDRHYRPSAKPRGRLVHWGSADYRPRIDG